MPIHTDREIISNQQFWRKVSSSTWCVFHGPTYGEPSGVLIMRVYFQRITYLRGLFVRGLGNGLGNVPIIWTDPTFLVCFHINVPTSVQRWVHAHTPTHTHTHPYIWDFKQRVRKGLVRWPEVIFFATRQRLITREFNIQLYHDGFSGGNDA